MTVTESPRDALYSGLLKLDAFASLLNQMAIAQEARSEGPESKVYWSLFYTAESLHGELAAAHDRLAKGGAS